MDMNIEMPKGYKLLANYKNEVILAEAENKEIPEPYVTWRVSNGTDIHTGKYFMNLENAERSFCDRAFGLYSLENSIAARDIKKDFEKCGVSSEPYVDNGESAKTKSSKSSAYYEEIIQEIIHPRYATEAVIARTRKNAGMVMAYIGTEHPAFETVFKYFIAQDYPNLKQRLLLPLKYLS